MATDWVPEYLDLSSVCRIAGATLPDPSSITFLVGSAVSLPDDYRGVPGVSSIIDYVRDELERVGQTLPHGADYQAAFAQLGRDVNQAACNRVVQRAVLQARHRVHESYADFLGFAKQPDYSSILAEHDSTPEGWYFPPAIHDLARLCSLYPNTFGQTVLTTNFDPLIERALDGLSSPNIASAVHSDGSFGGIRGTGTHVVHLHGYWQGADTLHTPTQIDIDRIAVKSELRRILESSTVIVVGYGGWSDVFMAALEECAADDRSTPDIVWCFYDKDETEISAKYAHVLTHLQPLAARGRARLAKGIDGKELFTELIRHSQKLRLAENQSVVLALFQRALWEHLYDPDPFASEGDAAKKLAEALGDWIAIRVTILALEECRSGGDSPIDDYYQVYQNYLDQHDIPLADFQHMEGLRIAAIESWENSSPSDRHPLDLSAINAGMALECHLALDRIGDKGAGVYCAQALHAIFKHRSTDRWAFWGTIIRRTLELLD